MTDLRATVPSIQKKLCMYCAQKVVSFTKIKIFGTDNVNFCKEQIIYILGIQWYWCKDNKYNISVVHSVVSQNIGRSRHVFHNQNTVQV